MSAISHLLNTTVTIRRATATSDAPGAFSLTPATVATLPGRLSSPSARDQEIGRRFEAVVTGTLYFEGDADVQRGDEMVVYDRTFLAIARVPPSVPTHHLKVLGQEVQQDAAA